MLILTIAQAAERIHRSPSWIYREIRKGVLVPTHYGSELRVRAHVLEKHVRSVAGRRRRPVDASATRIMAGGKRGVRRAKRSAARRA
jgi:hypothetical protein